MRPDPEAVQEGRTEDSRRRRRDNPVEHVSTQQGPSGDDTETRPQCRPDESVDTSGVVEPLAQSYERVANEQNPNGGQGERQRDSTPDRSRGALWVDVDR